MSATAPVPASTRRLYLFYHFLFPDDVVSAVHMDQLCEGLSARGWEVVAFPCNRGCRDENLSYPSSTDHNGVKLRRVWRPRFRQASSIGRLLNAAWMIVRWSALAIKSHPPRAIIVGTDPILSVVIAIVWKLLRPRTAIVHWAYDLYPEAAFADGLLSPTAVPAKLIEALLRRAYASCDAIVDIGPCMRQRLLRYASAARLATIVPWALEEPTQVLPIAIEERTRVFGSTQVAMLYSGSFGRAHTYRNFLALATILRGKDASIAFSVRGNREGELRAAVEATDPRERCRISFVPFAPAEALTQRLASPDVHLLSLDPAWTGLVVPSKFFGALAAGRPVLYSGGPDSSIAQWIHQYDLGWVLTDSNVEAVAADLCSYVNHPDRMRSTMERCRNTYQAHFSREAGVDQMHALLMELEGQ